MNTNDSGIFCPACKMKNETGAVLCVYCNTPLDHNSQKTLTLKKVQKITGTLPDHFDDFLDAPLLDTQRFMDFEIPDEGIVFINLENGQPVAIQKEESFILGRASDEIDTRQPLVDLTEVGALEYGISRTHVLVQKRGDRYEFTDLESTNGTWHENQRLAPKQVYPVESGDRIRMGRLHMLVFYL
jgi:hypothetical protein